MFRAFLFSFIVLFCSKAFSFEIYGCSEDFFKIGRSYHQNGSVYFPRYQPFYSERGIASWYGEEFKGNKTANGEIYDPSGMTAAHRTLPMHSVVSVYSFSTGNTVFVRINDRGPFSKDRIIDLSQESARRLGILDKGVGKVRVRYRFMDMDMLKSCSENRENSSSKRSLKNKESKFSGEKIVYIQIGFFLNSEGAQRYLKLFKKLYEPYKDLTYSVTLQKSRKNDDRIYYRILYGPFYSKSDAVDILDSIRSSGFEESFIFTREI